ncbi:glycosyltransferase family 2 protein [Phaeobacter sp. B1627]|uniref:glycosyltransferase family 2 protein n=1 Tax=Phaeobacter sp. B1627 TaxID=2583809 RepID=UPI0021065B47|nr:glycosyltransferase family 2 protein [Phaeobacter sp. B1627]
MNEPLAEVLRFCAWYIALGADEVVICFDNPEDPALELLSDHPRLRCIACTPEFWARVGLTAGDAFVTRQNAAMTWLYQQYDDGWLVNVDADEYLFLEAGGLVDLLAGVPEELHSVRIVTAERLVVQPGGEITYFRRPMSYEDRKSVYGADVELFGPRRGGLVGHPQGKSVVRCGVPGLTLRQHWPRTVKGQELRERLLDHHDGVHLLHMIGAEYQLWRSKLDWRCASRGFTAGLTTRVQAALAADDPEAALRSLFTRLHCADPALLERLDRHGALLRLRLNVDALVEEYFGISAHALPSGACGPDAGS